MTSSMGTAGLVANGSAKAALLSAVRAGQNDGATLAALERFALGPCQRDAEDIELLLAHAQNAWIAEQRNPQGCRARDAAQRLIAMVPELRDGYRLLGLAHLTRGEAQQAFMTFTAARQAIGEHSLDNFRALAQNLMLGADEARFAFERHEYAMPLSAHNAAAIEAGAFHSVGQLTEAEELRALAAVERPIRRIAEIGVLMGNHTAFFLQTFRPEHMTLIDADPANHPFIERTVALNTPSGCAPAVETACAFVGRGCGETTFAGAKVPHRRLNALVPGAVDLLKIDVDGGELALLEHGGEPIERCHPVVMIETTPVTDAPVRQWFAARGYGAPQVFDRGSYRNLIFRP